MKLNKFVFVGMLMTISQTTFAKLCPTVEAEQTNRNTRLKEKCGENILFDLSNYISTREICTSKRQAIDLTESVIFKFCSYAADGLKSKINSIKIKGVEQDQFEYKISNKALWITMPLSETSVLKKWSPESDKLHELIKKELGDAGITPEEIEAKRKAEKEIALKAEKEKIAKAKEEDKANREAQRELVQKKRDELRAKFNTYVQKYQKDVAELWAKPGNSASDIEAKNKQAKILEANLKQEEAKFKSEFESIK